MFVVQDVPQSVAHYRDVLGFRVEFTYGEPTFYAGVERDRVLIHLQAARETRRAPGQSAIYVFVTGVDALYEELKARGARVLHGVMTRRCFLLVLALPLVGRPLGAAAQPGQRLPRIGVLGEQSPSDPFLAAFRSGLRDAGYIEGQNIVVEYRPSSIPARST